MTDYLELKSEVGFWKATQPLRIIHDNVVRNLAAKATALQSDRICVRQKKVSNSRKIRCPGCGKPYVPYGPCQAEIIEVEVKAHKRIISRSCMKQGCRCSEFPAAITASMLLKLIPKSPFGNSIWEAILLTKFFYSQPTNRLLNGFAHFTKDGYRRVENTYTVV